MDVLYHNAANVTNWGFGVVIIGATSRDHTSLHAYSPSASQTELFFARLWITDRIVGYALNLWWRDHDMGFIEPQTLLFISHAKLFMVSIFCL